MGLPASDLLIPIEIENVSKIFLGNKMLKTKLKYFWFKIIHNIL